MNAAKSFGNIHFEKQPPITRIGILDMFNWIFTAGFLPVKIEKIKSLFSAELPGSIVRGKYPGKTGGRCRICHGTAENFAPEFGTHCR
jgi:hypothetical protein